MAKQDNQNQTRQTERQVVVVETEKIVQKSKNEINTKKA